MNFAAITRRIRRCESEVPAQLVLEYAIKEAVEAEREACAKTIETWGAELCIKDQDMQRLYVRQKVWREHYAAAIRERSN